MSANSDDERILELIAEGALSPDAPEVRARLERSPELAERVRKLTELSELLDEAASEEHATLRRAGELADAPGRDLVRSTLARAHFESDRASSRRPVRVRPWAAAAAAVLLLAGLIAALAVYGGRVDPDADGLPRQERTMLGAGLELVSPRGPVERYAPFTWRYALPRGGRFELVVLDRSTGEGGRELLRKTLEPPRPSRETTCDLSAEEEDALTSDILWTLRVLAADGDELAYAEERARRSSR